MNKKNRKSDFKKSARFCFFSFSFLGKAIPDSLLTDRQAITWQTQEGSGTTGGGRGTSMTALAVPQAVQDQVWTWTNARVIIFFDVVRAREAFTFALGCDEWCL